MGSKKRWIVACPRDCSCRQRSKPRHLKVGAQPKWLVEWQEGHVVPGQTPPAEGYMSPEKSEAQDILEDLPLGGSGSVSAMFRPTVPMPRLMSEPYSTITNEEESRPISTEGANRFRHHKSNVRPPKVFLPKSKTLGARDMAAINLPSDATDVDVVPNNSWNRIVSDGAVLSSTAASDNLGMEINALSRTSERRQSHVGFGTIILLSKKHGIPPLEVRQCAEEFRQFDTNRDGVLSMAEFEVAARKRCDIPPGEPIPDILRATMAKTADGRVDGCIGFEDFLLWVWQCIFMEEMSLTDSFEREQRNLARELGFDLPKLESLKEVFNSCDDDGSGYIEWPEFDQLVRCLLDAKEATDVSEALLRRYWKEANIGSSTGAIGFPDFVRWYAKNFA